MTNIIKDIIEISNIILIILYIFIFSSFLLFITDIINSLIGMHTLQHFLLHQKVMIFTFERENSGDDKFFHQKAYTIRHNDICQHISNICVKSLLHPNPILPRLVTLYDVGLNKIVVKHLINSLNNNS